MNIASRFALGAVAVAVIALGGFYVLDLGGSGSVGGPSPSATPAVSPTPTPRPFPTDTSGGVPVEPGTYVLDLPARDGGTGAATTLRITFTMPAGWEKNLTPTMLWHTDHRRIGFFAADNLIADPCGSSGNGIEPRLGPTADDLATGLLRLPGVTASAVTTVSVGGFNGKQLVLTAPEGPSPCIDDPALWTAVPGPSGIAPSGAAPLLPTGEQLRLDILDVATSRLVIAQISGSDTSGAADIAEMQAIVDTIGIERIDSTTPPSASPGPS